MLRIPDDKVHKPHNKCTNMAEKASTSEKIKLKVGVSWAQVVDDRFLLYQLKLLEFKFLNQHVTMQHFEVKTGKSYCTFNWGINLLT